MALCTAARVTSDRTQVLLHEAVPSSLSEFHKPDKRMTITTQQKFSSSTSSGCSFVLFTLSDISS